MWTSTTNLLLLTCCFAFLVSAAAAVDTQDSDYCAQPNTASVEGGTETRSVVIGSHFSLTCCLQSDASTGTGVLTWFQPNGDKIPNYFIDSGATGSRIYVLPDFLLDSLDNRQITHLVIRNFTTADAGDYTCRDVAGNAKPARVKLVPRQRIFIDSSRVQFLEENQVGQLFCRVRGHPRINVAWFFNGRHIGPTGQQQSASSPYVFLHNDQVLQIDQVSEENAGSYLCKAEVEEGESKTGDRSPQMIEMHPIRAIVYAQPTFSSDSPRLMASNQIVFEGEMMELVCTATGLPAPRIIWLRDGLLLEPDGRRIIVENNFAHRTIHSTLKVNALTSADAGNYTCRAVLEFDESGVNLTAIAEASLVPEMSFRPRFLPEGSQMTAEGPIGGNATLTCEVLGARLSREQMVLGLVRKGNESMEFSENPRYRLETTELPHNPLIARLTFQVTDLQPDDGGEYACRAQSTVPGSPIVWSSPGRLTVWYAPVVTPVTGADTQSAVFGLPHHVSRLVCSARGMPQPDWQWTVHATVIDPENSKYRMSVVETPGMPDLTTAELVILPSYWDLSVFGTYECRATNRLGSDAARLRLRQAWRPDNPSMAACKIESTVVELCIQPPEQTGGLPLTHYELRVQTKPHGNFHGPYAYPIHPNQINLTSLVPGSYYRFALSAVSAAGRSPNTYVEVATKRLTQPVIELISQSESQEPNAYSLRWRVETDGGLPISDYKIQLRPVELDRNNGHVVRGLKPWTEYSHIRPDSKPLFRVNSLVPNTDYELVLMARNSMGYSKQKHIIFRTMDAPAHSGALSVRTGANGATAMAGSGFSKRVLLGVLSMLLCVMSPISF